MKLIRMKSCLAEILNWKAEISKFITDKQIQIRAYSCEEYGLQKKNLNHPHIIHYVDVLHVSKSVYFNSPTCMNNRSFSVII